MIDPFTAELTPSRALHRAGTTTRQVRRLVDDGVFVRVRRGVLVRGDEWRALRPEGRAIVRARAWASVAGDEPLFSHTTAAAVHGLPLFRTRSDTVHTIVSESRKGQTPGVARHRGELDAGVTRVRGLLLTDLARTMADVARSESAETAVTVADAALRSASRSADHPRVVVLRQQALDHAAALARGGKRSARIIEFADPRAQLPGESVSRLYLLRLGFASPRLQVEVPGPRGIRYFVDFGLDDVDAFGEFDGEGKYLDPRYLNGRTSEQALLEEKWREDWIRGTTQRRYARWGSAHIATAQTLGARLAHFSIVPARRA